MRPARLERHHEGLAGGVHNSVSDLETPFIEPGQNLQADAGPRFDSGIAPRGDGRFGGLEQDLQIRLGIRDAERLTVRRELSANAARGPGLVDLEWLVKP